MHNEGNDIEIIQINISGEDKPGMTSSLTAILARYDAFILDIGQANIHQSLTLGILIRTTADKSGSIMKELLFKASELGVRIRFAPISEERYNAWVARQGKNRYIITLLGRRVTAQHIAEVTGVVADHGLNIDAIRRLTGRASATVCAPSPSVPCAAKSISARASRSAWRCSRGSTCRSWRRSPATCPSPKGWSA